MMGYENRDEDGMVIHPGAKLIKCWASREISLEAQDMNGETGTSLVGYVHVINLAHT